jgi:hypothetical protein
MAETKDNEAEAKAQRKAAGIAKREARAELKAKAKVEANKTKEALTPLRNRVQGLIEDYEHTATFEHARRMDKLLHGLLRAVEIGCQEAQKDLARISEGEQPCQPSVLRQRLDDLLWDAQ